jgi:hypothetical protein
MGKKTGRPRGRPKGAKNKRTAEREAAVSEASVQISKALGSAFEGDAHAYLMSIYKDPTKPENLRIDAAKTAIRYERPALAPVEEPAKSDAVPLAERLKAYLREDGIEGSAAKVVELKKSSQSKAALRWLQHPDPGFLHVLTLAHWGLENGARGEWPARDRWAVEEQVGQLLGWEPANALAWLLYNPNGPDDPKEQEQELLRDLETAESAKQAAARLLSAIYSRQQAELPALQPAASELR